MERWAGLAVGGAALLVGFWNAWNLREVSARLNGLDVGVSSPLASGIQRRPLAQMFGPSQVDDDPESVRAAAEQAGVDPGGANLDNPEVRARLMDVVRQEQDRAVDERRAQFRDSMIAEVESFAVDEGIDDEVAEQMIAEIEIRMQGMMDIRDGIRSGDIGMFEARREMMANREDGRDAMIELIGEERTAALQQRLFGGLRPGGLGGGLPGGAQGL